jgi:hypothetical protein
LFCTSASLGRQDRGMFSIPCKFVVMASIVVTPKGPKLDAELEIREQNWCILMFYLLGNVCSSKWIRAWCLLLVGLRLACICIKSLCIYVCTLLHTLHC